MRIPVHTWAIALSPGGPVSLTLLNEDDAALAVNWLRSLTARGRLIGADGAAVSVDGPGFTRLPVTLDLPVSSLAEARAAGYVVDDAALERLLAAAEVPAEREPPAEEAVP